MVPVIIIILLLLSTLPSSLSSSIPNYSTKGKWKLLKSSIGVSAMHMALLPNDRIITFDRTDFGPSNITFPAEKCPPGLDCYAHSVEFYPAKRGVRPLTILTDTWCSSGALLPNGVLIQSGGNNTGERVVRTFNPCDDCDWVETRDGLVSPRWYASNQLLPDGKVIIVGGRRQFTYEFIPKSSISAKKAAFFDLEDIDSQDVSKPIKVTSPTASKMPSPPPKPKGNTSKKRKGTATATPESSLFEGLTPQEVLAKISQLSLQGHEYVLKSLDDMSAQLQETSTALEDTRKISLTKEKYYEVKLAKVEGELKKALAEKIKMAEEHEKEMEEYRRGLINSATVSVHQARVKIALQANDPNFNRAEWDIEGWQAKIVSLSGKEVVYTPVQQSEDPSGTDAVVEPDQTILEIARETVEAAAVGDEGKDAKA